MRERLQEIARTAGSFFSQHRLENVTQKEGHANFVTNIDREVEDYLNDALRKLLPGSAMIGEEKENGALTDAPTWIVDPVDGTTNLIHDYGCSAVSIALCERREPVIALIWQPYTREMFYAESGKGAELNGRRIHAADTPFDRALVSFGTSPYNAELADKSLQIALAFLRECADIRRCGSAAVDLAYVACGRQDVFFELNLKPWDYAAGNLIAREAGAVFRMPLLSAPAYDQNTAILAAAPSCAEAAEKLLGGLLEGSGCFERTDE